MTTWAILIGINFYVQDRHLHGAVQDVRDMGAYLEANHEHVKLSILTASAPQNSNDKVPIEEPDAWPTFENIKGQLDHIEQAANEMDFLYIHFSGHGTQQPVVSREYKERGTSDVALVLFDPTTGSRYLRGVDLARLLQRLAKKGLKVTVVLDCCYSGGVTRRGKLMPLSTRGVEWDPAIAAQFPLEQVPHLFESPTVTRDATSEFKWLESARGYTIITACGPHEKTWEGDINGTKHGVMSFLLLSALSRAARSGFHSSHESVYQYLRTKCHANYSFQNPMLFGDRAVSFLGGLRFPSSSLSEIFTAEGSLHVSAGRAHGVSKGDEYEVFPFDPSMSIQNLAITTSARVMVNAVHGLTCDVDVTQASPSGDDIRTGWKARPLTHFSIQKVHVKIASGVDVGRDWSYALASSKFLQPFAEDTDSPTSLCQVILNDHVEYEVLDILGNRLMNVPAISARISGVIPLVVRILEHVARYQFIEALENGLVSSWLETAFTVDILDSQQRPLDANGVVEVREHEVINFTFRNHSHHPLYLTIYDLTPGWQIQGVFSTGAGQITGSYNQKTAQSTTQVTKAYR
ncbi:uncharacterized protein KY384_000536 [Bacidia gigantensis]|uniref:uncharacterized protein n=1 Tax=Bacidia gigantensis TaxID=2732470 RepID=UPI001D0478BF|nr:uncharacterized protein KY384_000536 [Bacidia gigantensis]KAG8525776.1 hypothetical protein KY384_000536 [Bacidia gigantensis]